MKELSGGKPRTATKGQLASADGVHLSTFNKWISLVPGLNLSPGQRVLTPKQVMTIMEHLG